MDNYQGVIPFIWKRIRQYRFRDSYQQMNKEYYHPRRRRQTVMKSTSMGRRSWGLKMPKLRVCASFPGTSNKRIGASDDEYDSVGLNYMLKGGSMVAASAYNKWER
ncbi:hypothetical protein R1flu_027555 [Riccia fluitans]|uniref:Uncharacterized protein n=1 Tax=Riccia fluitans TaxID=41844 RepID=A0ABD1XJ64_9MARC